MLQNLDPLARKSLGLLACAITAALCAWFSRFLSPAFGETAATAAYWFSAAIFCLTFVVGFLGLYVLWQSRSEA
ncbi:hypothetical protein SDC9_69794 [bioreactor metagenome]|uniref:Uncharacterized protein n=1 Tax=bioreactor metagenome TaxID=1076179 RepID=A0A644Y9S5_9ZZZZ